MTLIPTKTFRSEVSSIWGKIYVPTDSLHLLEPIDGVRITYNSGDVTKHSFVIPPQDQPCGRIRLENGNACDIGGVRIIQRNGIPFHWPEDITNG
jgi:hypothetical protein